MTKAIFNSFFSPRAHSQSTNGIHNLWMPALFRNEASVWYMAIIAWSEGAPLLNAPSISRSHSICLVCAKRSLLRVQLNLKDVRVVKL